MWSAAAAVAVLSRRRRQPSGSEETAGTERAEQATTEELCGGGGAGGAGLPRAGPPPRPAAGRAAVRAQRSQPHLRVQLCVGSREQVPGAGEGAGQLQQRGQRVRGAGAAGRPGWRVTTAARTQEDTPAGAAR